MQVDDLLEDLANELNQRQREEIESERKEAFEMGRQDAMSEFEDLQSEDSKYSLAFAINEVKESIERGVSMEDLLRDLTIRSCRFM